MLKHYYHIYSTGKWKPPVSEHIDALEKSGLIGVLDYFGVGIIGHPSYRQTVKNYLISRGVKFSVVVEANDGWEQKTLDVVECEDEDYVLYAHTKGAANPSDHSDQWRASMTEGLIGRWPRAVELLKESDAVGSHWLEVNNFPRHYSGNFFWARGDYINRLVRPVDMSSRWSAEMWIGGGHGRMYDLATGGPSNGNWLFENDVGQDGVPDGCVRFYVANSIAGMEKGKVYVRVLDAGVSMCIREGHFQILGKRREHVYDYREKASDG